MNKVWKVGALWLAICVVVWLFTVWRWQVNGQDPGTSEIVWQLLALPVMLTVVMVLSLWGAGRLRLQVAQASQAATVPAPVDVPAASAIGDSDEALRKAWAWVLGDAVHAAPGADGDTVWAGIQGQRARAQLDPHLRDLDGLPVFTAGVAALDPVTWAAEQPDLAALAEQAGRAEVEAVLRGLALLASPLQDMLMVFEALVPPSPATSSLDLDPHVPAQATENATQSATQSATGSVKRPLHLAGVRAAPSAAALAAARAMAPVLTVRLLLPAAWPEAERTRAAGWVQAQCGAVLDWARAAKAQGVHWHCGVLASPEALWDEVDRCVVRWHTEARPELLWVLAVDTALTDDAVARMQAMGELFTAQHQTGRVPGEAAVSLLLAHPHWPLDRASLPNPPARLWRPARARRDKSADAAGRVGADVLGEAFTQAMGVSGATPEALHIVADGDHRASRTAELYEALLAVAPALDPMQAVTRAGEACGDVGVARALLPVVLARAALREAEPGQRVALAANVQSPHDRVVVALAVPAEPSTA